jgi:FkbM family methyltransferase
VQRVTKYVPPPPEPFRLSREIVTVLRRWQWAYHKKWIRRTRPRFGVEKRLGCNWLLDQKSAVDRSLIVRGFWEPKQLALLCQLATENRPPGVRTLFLDIGAHIGVYSILMHKAVAFDEHVMFEPEPANAAQLSANLLLNDLLGTLRLVNAAASDKPGRILFKSGPDHNRGIARMLNAGLPELPWETRVVEVDTVRVGDVVSLEGGFLVAKMDVEGAELAALAGMEKLLAANRCVLQIECFQGAEDALIGWLEPRGFRHVAQIDVDHFFVKMEADSAAA